MPQEFKRPLELAALKGRLERARVQQVKIGATGARYDKVLDAIDEKIQQSTLHVEHLERYDGELAAMIQQMIGTSNERPTEGGSDGRPSTAGEVKTVADGDVAKIKTE